MTVATMQNYALDSTSFQGVHMLTSDKLREIIFLVEESLEGGYTAQALGYAIYTEADTWSELKEAIRDALWCHFEDNRPMLMRLHIVREEVVLV